MSPESTHRQDRYFPTAIALIGGYFSIRAALLLPKLRAVVETSYQDEPVWSVSRLIFFHPTLFLVLVIATLVITLVAIWNKFQKSAVVYSVGIVFQFLLGERALASIVDPIVRIISEMSQ